MTERRMSKGRSGRRWRAAGRPTRASRASSHDGKSETLRFQENYKFWVLLQLPPLLSAARGFAHHEQNRIRGAAVIDAEVPGDSAIDEAQDRTAMEVEAIERPAHQVAERNHQQAT